MFTYERLNELMGDLCLVGRPEREVLGLLLVELKDCAMEIDRLKARVSALEESARSRRKPKSQR